MPEFSYKAKRGPTEVVSGSVEAATLDEAVEKLDRLGLFPIRVDEVKPGQTASKPEEPVQEQKIEKKTEPAVSSAPKLHRPSIFSRVKSSEITLFGRQMSSLIKSGVPILKALWIIGEQSENPRLKQFLDTAQRDINNGKTF